MRRAVHFSLLTEHRLFALHLSCGHIVLNPSPHRSWATCHRCPVKRRAKVARKKPAQKAKRHR